MCGSNIIGGIYMGRVRSCWHSLCLTDLKTSTQGTKYLRAWLVLASFTHLPFCLSSFISWSRSLTKEPKYKIHLIPLYFCHLTLSWTCVWVRFPLVMWFSLQPLSLFVLYLSSLTTVGVRFVYTRVGASADDVSCVCCPKAKGTSWR